MRLRVPNLLRNNRACRGCRWSALVPGVVSMVLAASLPAAAQDRPYGGSAWPVPGGIQAEDFNEGGQGVGYSDHTSGNTGGHYRWTDVDIATTSAGGFAVGWIGAGEWLKYTINVASSGNYTIVLRVASAGSGGTFHIEFNGEDKTGALRVPDTGGWGTYQDLPVGVTLSQGVQTMRIVFDSNGSTGAVGNLSFFRFDAGGSGSSTSSSGGSGATPFGGSAWAIPGTVQAEDFDQGGEAVAYHDTTPGNTGGSYRSTNVDIAPLSGGGHTVGWIASGEWLRYTVNVASGGTYTAIARVASAGSGGTFHIEFNGENKTGSLRVPNTGSWNTYQELSVSVSLSAGVQSMRVVFDSNGSTGAVGNLSSVRFEAGGGGGSSGGRAPYGGSVWAVPGTIQAEDFDTGGQDVAYHDNTWGNTGGLYRSTDVDIAATSSGGHTIGWTEPGEWLRYSVNVSSAGTYTLVARVASNGGGGTFHVEFNGENKTGSLRVPNTGGWSTYTDVSATISLSAGQQTMTVVFDEAGSTGAIGNLSFISLATGSSAPASPPPPPQGSGGRLRVMTWNIHGWDSSDIAGQAWVMANSGAHVILLQEATTQFENLPSSLPQRLQQLTGHTWYSVWAPHYGRYSSSEGTLILSRLAPVDSSTMRAYDRGFGRVRVSVGGVLVNVFTLHLDWYDTSMRSAQLEEFLSWSRQFGGPRIAGGDMNSWWGEYWIRRMENEYSDTWQDVTGSDENGYTLNGAVRFDYLFRAYEDNWRITPTNCWVTSTGTSDHWPVIADYNVQ